MLILVLIGAACVSIGVAWIGYERGKEAQRRSDDNAEREVKRLRLQRLRARHEEVKPLWDAYSASVEKAREAFEAACTLPHYHIEKKTDEDYPGFGVKMRRITADYPGQKGEHAYDEDGKFTFFISNTPPGEPSFTVDYVVPEPRMIFPTAPDAEAWLEARLHPEKPPGAMTLKAAPWVRSTAPCCPSRC